MKNIKGGFTLAELLIVLGIIGIVAALTIPTLTANYRQKIVETKIKKFYAVISQVIERSESVNGPIAWWSFPSVVVGGGGDVTAWYDKYFTPYLEARVMLKNFHLGNVWWSGFSVQFNDGSAASCAPSNGGYKMLCIYYPSIKDITKIRDNTSETNELIVGKNAFVFQINEKGFQSAVDNDTCVPQKGITGGSSVAYGNTGKGCTTLLMQNNWEFPKDYPVKF